MKPISLSRRRQLLDYVEPLEPLGFSASRILQPHSLSRWLYGAPDDWIPMRAAVSAMSSAARATGDDLYGFWVAEQDEIGNLHTIGRAVANAVTLYDALTTVCRLIKFHSPALQLWLTIEGDKVWFCRREPPGGEIDSRHMEQYLLVKMTQVVRLGLGSGWRPRGIKLHVPDAKHVASSALCGDATIHCGQPYTAIGFSRNELCLSVQRAGPKPGPAWYQALRHHPPPEGFIDSLRHVVDSHLSEGALRIEDVADFAGVSVSTLKRWLAKDQLTYTKLVAQTRHKAAQRRLSDPTMPIRDIAYDLGYSDVPHFHRAFRRWAGVTPGEYRQHLLRQPHRLN